MFFNLLFLLYTLIYLPYLLLTGRWYKGYGSRLGLFSSELQARLKGNSNIWIHAVSVGEIMAIAPVVAQIKARFPNQSIVVTVTTKTGYALAQSKLAQSAIVLASPLDFSWVTSFFVRLINPKIYIAAETEIWPNLFNCLSKRKVPIVIINGRISDRSFGRYKAIKIFLSKTLQKVSLFCMQSDIDANRIIELGAIKQKVLVLGNLKFDDLVLSQENVNELPAPKNRLLWIAGSTHPGEEEIVLKIFSQHKDSCALMIAPRHVERSEQIAQLVQSKGLKAVRFSQLSSNSWSSDTVVIVDTIGHLRSLYSKASFVFVGKSLCGGGGQNIIEPAFYAKPIIVGPMMENFRDITELFKNKDAIVQVKDAEQLEYEVGYLLKDENVRTQLGRKALEVVKANQGALDRTLKILERWL